MTFQPPTIEVDGEDLLNPASQTYARMDADKIRRLFRIQAAGLAGQLFKLIQSLASGEVGRRAFVRQSMAALQRAYYNVFALGALSVDPFHVTTPEDVNVLNAELFGERKFLQSFAGDIARGSFEMAPETRAVLYFQALRGVFELGRVRALPAGPFDWILGDTDHCVPCLSASLNGPYKRDSLSRMSLPVVPGIPGTGEVCQGLTRCGCTLRLRNFPVNENLQLGLRDILVELS